MDLNKVQLIGRLTRDPEVKSTGGSDSSAKFTLATSKEWNDKDGNRQQKAQFTTIMVWGKLAGVCGSYLKKGSKIYAEGELETNEYTDKEGIKKYFTQVNLRNMIMLESKGMAQKEEKPVEEAPEETEVDLNDIPF